MPSKLIDKIADDLNEYFMACSFAVLSEFSYFAF